MDENFVSRKSGTILWCISIWLLPAAPVRAFQPDRTVLRQMFEESLKRRKQEFGQNDSHTAQAARDLGLFLQRNGDAAAARRALTETVAIDEAVFGKTASETLEDVSALAAVSPPALAVPLLRRAAESSDPGVAGPALSSLADLRTAAGDRAGAAAYLRLALEKAEAVDEKDGVIVALILNTLALDVEPKVGVAFLERALRIDRVKLGERDEGTILTEVNLSRVLLAAGRVDDALGMARTALGASEAAFGAGHPGTADALTGLARATLAKGDKAEAERLYRQALSITQKAFGPTDSRTRKNGLELAALLRQSGKIAEAAALERTFSAPLGR
jgi:tetratricopeptide (TPR) repeat protein